MRVYKFINTKFGHESIQRKRLKVSRFDNLNDPFDFNALTFNTIAERMAWQQTVSNFGKDKALMCFSKHFDNPLLWSHYAEDHKGMALGFDLDESVRAHPMKYTSDFIDARCFVDLDHQGRRAIVEEAFVRKFEQWHYENEVRALVDLDHATSENGLYFLDFGTILQLKEVILGARHENISSLLNSSKEQGIQVKQANLSSQMYRIVCTDCEL